MKSLLTAIKAQLQTDLTYVRDSDVFVTEDELVIPEAVRFPAVGIKDGPVEWSVMSSGPDKLQDMTVTVIAYVQPIKSEAAIMGDDATGNKGVLDIIDDIRTSLDEDTLSDEVSDAEVVSETESVPVFDENKMLALQMKTITFKYERWSVASGQ